MKVCHLRNRETTGGSRTWTCQRSPAPYEYREIHTVTTIAPPCTADLWNDATDVYGSRRRGHQGTKCVLCFATALQHRYWTDSCISRGEWAMPVIRGSSLFNKCHPDQPQLPTRFLPLAAGLSRLRWGACGLTQKSQLKLGVGPTGSLRR